MSGKKFFYPPSVLAKSNAHPWEIFCTYWSPNTCDLLWCQKYVSSMIQFKSTLTYACQEFFLFSVPSGEVNWDTGLYRDKNLLVEFTPVDGSNEIKFWRIFVTDLKLISRKIDTRGICISEVITVWSEVETQVHRDVNTALIAYFSTVKKEQLKPIDLNLFT